MENTIIDAEPTSRPKCYRAFAAGHFNSLRDDDRNSIFSVDHRNYKKPRKKKVNKPPSNHIAQMTLTPIDLCLFVPTISGRNIIAGVVTI